MKKPWSLLLAAILVVGLVGCTTPIAENPQQPSNPAVTPSADDGEIKNVLFLASTTAVEYFTNAYNAMKPAFEEVGMTLTLRGPTQPDQMEEQLSMFENAVSSGEYDLILLYPTVPRAFVDAVRASERQGIPVIAYQMSPEMDCGTYYAGPDNTEQGRLAAQSMIDFVNSHADHFGAMDSIPIIMSTTAASEEILKRANGFKEVIEADGRFEIVMEQAAVGTEQGMAFGETAITAFPDVELFFSVQDAAGMGIHNAIQASRTPTETMGIFSIDGTGAVLSAIDSGELYRATVGAPFAEQAPDLARFIQEIQSGTVEVGAVNSFPVVVITQENAAQYMN